MDNCIMRTNDEDITWPPFEIPQHGADSMTRIGDEDEFIGLGADELCEALANVHEEWLKSQTHKFVGVAFNESG